MDRRHFVVPPVREPTFHLILCLSNHYLYSRIRLLQRLSDLRIDMTSSLSLQFVNFASNVSESGWSQYGFYHSQKLCITCNWHWLWEPTLRASQGNRLYHSGNISRSAELISRLIFQGALDDDWFHLWRLFPFILMKIYDNSLLHHLSRNFIWN